MSTPGRALWANADFKKLWAAKGVSDFGSLISGTALSFTAILYLKASPAQLGLLMAANLLPRFLTGPAAGLVADRLPRRFVMIAADLGRALLLVTVPLAALAGRLNIWHLYVVTAVTGLLSLLFDVADRSYLPALVAPDELVAANSRLTVTASIAEFSAFSLGGWLVQWFTAPLAILIDAISFLFSAASLALIRTTEPPRAADAARPGFRAEIVEGWTALRVDPILVSLAWITVLTGFEGGILGAVIVAFMTRDLGFHPGVLGMIWSLGGIASLCGALAAGPILRRVKIGPAMAGALVVITVCLLATPLAHGATWGAAALLTVSQLGDAAYTMFDIHRASLLQARIPAHVRGRVNGLYETIGLGATLLAALLGGMVAERIGLRATVAGAALFLVASAAVAWFSPLRHAPTPES